MGHVCVGDEVEGGSMSDKSNRDEHRDEEFHNELGNSYAYMNTNTVPEGSIGRATVHALLAIAYALRDIRDELRELKR